MSTLQEWQPGPALRGLLQDLAPLRKRLLEHGLYRNAQCLILSVGPAWGWALTLIMEEKLEEIERETGLKITATDSRRNILTRGVALDDLVGKRSNKRTLRAPLHADIPI